MKILSALIVAFSLFFVSLSYAKNINLYEQPKADSKLVGTIDSNAGIMTIFTPKEGGWVKVADPRNGNVGWIKSTDLNDIGFHVNVMTSGDGTQQYQVIQYGTTKPANPAQLSESMKQMQLRREAIQKDMQQMMQDMYTNSPWMNAPIIMPVLIVPEKHFQMKPIPPNAKDLTPLNPLPTNKK